MKPETKQKVNGFSLFMLRALATILLSLVLFILNDLHTDIREMRIGLSSLQSEIVYRCEYSDDMKIIRDYLTDIEKRLDGR